MTPVIFRKWPESEGGEIIALFPTELGTNELYTSSSYAHISLLRNASCLKKK